MRIAQDLDSFLFNCCCCSRCIVRSSPLVFCCSALDTFHSSLSFRYFRTRCPWPSCFGVVVVVSSLDTCQMTLENLFHFFMEFLLFVFVFNAFVFVVAAVCFEYLQSFVLLLLSLLLLFYCVGIAFVHWKEGSTGPTSPSSRSLIVNCFLFDKCWA